MDDRHRVSTEHDPPAACNPNQSAVLEHRDQRGATVLTYRPAVLRVLPLPAAKAPAPRLQVRKNTAGGRGRLTAWSRRDVTKVGPIHRLVTQAVDLFLSEITSSVGLDLVLVTADGRAGQRTENAIHRSFVIIEAL